MARAETMTPQEAAELSHPMQETRIFYREDMLLRKFGFSIVARPNGKPALWTRGGKIYTHSEALLVLKRKQETAEAKG